MRAHIATSRRVVLQHKTRMKDGKNDQCCAKDNSCRAHRFKRCNPIGLTCRTVHWLVKALHDSGIFVAIHISYFTRTSIKPAALNAMCVTMGRPSVADRRRE